MINVKEIINDWNSICTNMESAIKERDYRNFRLALRHGTNCFQTIQQQMVKGPKDQFFEHKYEIKNLMERWTSLSVKIDPWMKEIKQEIEKNRQNNVKGKKLSQAYTFMKKTGRNLQVKAR